MSSRSLNKVILIGNLTRDPELRYTPAGTAVCSMGLATNRQWTTESGEKREEVEFHRLVAWNKLAELCAQLLTKGRKIFVEGRLQTRTWQAQDGNQRTTTEIVIDDMIILDSRRMGEEAAPSGQSMATGVTVEPAGEDTTAVVADDAAKKKKSAKSGSAPAEKPAATEDAEKEEEINPDDIPF